MGAPLYEKKFNSRAMLFFTMDRKGKRDLLTG
jgi:hypothetical protein